MKGTKREELFETGICEKTHSKQTIVSTILKLKASIDEPIIVIKGDNLEELFFKDVYNIDGCIFLAGANIPGESLLGYIKNINSSNSTAVTAERIKKFFSVVSNIVNALIVYIRKQKSYPLPILSSIFYDKKTGSVTFLPGKISKLLSSYLPTDEQTINNFCIKDPLKESLNTEEELAKSIVYLIYLFFLKISNSKLQKSIIYDVRSLIKGVPVDIANKIWKVLRGKEKITLYDIKKFLEEHNSIELNKKNYPLPFFRSKGFQNFFYNLSYTILYKWKLILLIAVIAGIFIYIIGDLIYKIKLSDITSGKTPYEVVEMYIKSIKDLDVETLNSILYKRAGKDIIKEVSSLYVVKRMTEVYGVRWLKPTEVNLKDLPENVKVYGIENVKIKKISDIDEPIFSVTYTKIFGEKGDLSNYNYQEVLKLKKVKNRWFIFSVSRKLINQKDIK